MKTYVFSFISFFDNVMTSKIIESSEDPVTLVQEELTEKGWAMDPEGYDIDSIEDLKRFAFDCDSMFEIIEVPGPVG